MPPMPRLPPRAIQSTQRAMLIGRRLAVPPFDQISSIPPPTERCREIFSIDDRAPYEAPARIPKTPRGWRRPSRQSPGRRLRCRPAHAVSADICAAGACRYDSRKESALINPASEVRRCAEARRVLPHARRAMRRAQMLRYQQIRKRRVTAMARRCHRLALFVHVSRLSGNACWRLYQKIYRQR